jgi:hypothetical protein
MTAFDGSRVKVGPGTLYVAPLGTTEPTGVTGAWAAGWVPLGYTDAGSTFSLTPTVQAVSVEEEYWPVKNVITGYAGDLTFNLAEETRQNLLVALNAGIGSSLVSGTSGTNVDGSQWAEMPDIGSEVRVMLGWDAISKAGTTSTDPFGRLIVRQAFQTGNMQIVRRKGNAKATYACKFTLEKPAGVQPFRLIFPPSLAS